MPSMSLIERLTYDLNEVRKELAEEVSRFTPEEFAWTPAEGMHPCRDILLEIGTMEQVSLIMAERGVEADWGTIWNSLTEKASDGASLLAALNEIRANTLAYLDRTSVETLRTPMALPASWHGYLGAPEIEPEELIRWIAKHEYYHLGQLIIYRWQLGDDPNRREAPAETK